MKKFPLLLLLLAGKTILFGQENYPCSCQGIIDPAYKGVVKIFDKPNGKMMRGLRQNFKNEDFLVFQIDSATSSYFHATITYAVSGKKHAGWISKKEYIGTFPRVYADTAYLYEKANNRAKRLAGIPTGRNSLVQIVNCNNKWVYVKTKGHEIRLQGWLKPEDQCANPYTTCN